MESEGFMDYCINGMVEGLSVRVVTRSMTARRNLLGGFCVSFAIFGVSFFCGVSITLAQSVQSWRRRWPRYWNDRGRTSPRRAARGGENESWREWRTHVPYAQLTDPHRRRKGFEVGRFSKRSDQQDDVESTIRERAGQVGEDAFRACGPEVGDEEDDLPIHGVHGFPVARGFRRRRPFGDDITERLFATLLHAGFSGRLPSAEAVVAIGRLHNGP